MIQVQLPKELKPIQFCRRYVPPPPPEPGVRRLPEDIEAEIKKQEGEYDQLLYITIE